MAAALGLKVRMKASKERNNPQEAVATLSLHALGSSADILCLMYDIYCLPELRKKPLCPLVAKFFDLCDSTLSRPPAFTADL